MYIARVTMFALFGLVSAISHAQPYGSFIGEVQTEWLSDGRNMRLLKEFMYVDPKGEKWVAPMGSVVNGASIPRFAWSFIGGPFEGKYRNASVIHDVACDQKIRSWQVVHEAFHYAMLASGVNNTLAATMYAAVYHFGPRWVVRIPFRQVPRDQVQATVGKIKSQADPKAEVQVSELKNYIVTQPSATASQKDREVAVSDFVVQVAPPERVLKEIDFPDLEKKIKNDSMSLQEIRDYRPSPPTNLRVN